VIRATAVNLLVILILAKASCAQENKPLGDMAREARAAKSSSPKSATVITNDDVPSGKNQGVTGKLSPDKQAFCDKLRQRKDPAAEQGCALMSVDMGPEYENLTSRYAELAENLCGASEDEGYLRRSPKSLRSRHNGVKKMLLAPSLWQ
jgi:hypothetical protein